jgi:hypothetical protein
MNHDENIITKKPHGHVRKVDKMLVLSDMLSQLCRKCVVKYTDYRSNRSNGLCTTAGADTLSKKKNKETQYKAKLVYWRAGSSITERFGKKPSWFFSFYVISGDKQQGDMLKSLTE